MQKGWRPLKAFRQEKASFRARATGCVDEHDVDNRARKKAKFDESDDDRNDAKETSF